RRHTSSDRDWSSDVCSSDLHALALGPQRGAPFFTAGALVRDFELEASEGRRVVVRGLFSGVLMGHDVPVILGAHRNARSFRSARSEERRVGKECGGGWGGDQ